MLAQLFQNSSNIKSSGFIGVLVICTPSSKVEINATGCVN